MGRKKLPEVYSPINVNHTARLDSLRAIRIEQARLYRAAIRGRLPSDEMTRLVYALKEIRSTLEAEIAAKEIEAPTPIQEVRIRSIPSTYCIDESDPERIRPMLAIEHEAAPEPIEQPIAQIEEPELIDEIEPEPALVESEMDRWRRQALESEQRGEGVVMRPPRITRRFPKPSF